MSETTVKKISNVSPTSQIKWSKFLEIRRICEEDFWRELGCAVSMIPTTFYPEESRGWRTAPLLISALAWGSPEQSESSWYVFPEEGHTGLVSASWLIKLKHEREIGWNGLCQKRSEPHLRVCALFSKVRSKAPKSQGPDVEFLVGMLPGNLFKRAPDKELREALAL